MTLYKRALFKRIKDKYAPDEVDKLAFLIIVAFLTIFSVMGCIEAYASEVEDVSTNVVNGLFINENGNYFVSSSTNNLIYFVGESGYIYHIKNLNISTPLKFVSSSEVPSVNVTYNWIGTIDPQATYDYIPTSANTLYLDVSSNDTGTNVIVTREKIPGYSGAVNDLVDNVGTQQIWNVFDISIDYIIIAVAVAFGIFLIVLAIRKISKGKSEF